MARQNRASLSSIGSGGGAGAEPAAAKASAQQRLRRSREEVRRRQEHSRRIAEFLLESDVGGVASRTHRSRRPGAGMLRVSQPSGGNKGQSRAPGRTATRRRGRGVRCRAEQSCTHPVAPNSASHIRSQPLLAAGSLVSRVLDQQDVFSLFAGRGGVYGVSAVLPRGSPDSGP
jgi:hypothetical protein